MIDHHHPTPGQEVLTCTGCQARLYRQPEPDLPATGPLAWRAESLAFRNRHSACGHQLDLLGELATAAARDTTHHPEDE